MRHELAVQISWAKGKGLFDIPEAQQQHLRSPCLDAPGHKDESESAAQSKSQMES